MSVEIKEINPSALTRQEIGFILGSCFGDWPEVVRELAAGRATVVRLAGKKFKGVAIIQALDSGRTLFIWKFGGENLWRESRAAILATKQFAREYRFESVRAWTKPTLARLLRREGFITPESAVEWRVERWE